MIVISICTLPGRLHSLIAVLENLLNQTVKPDLVMISVADYYPRAGKYYDEEDLLHLETWLEHYTIKSEIVKVELDTGPCRKLTTPLLKRSIKDEDFIITIDDDAPFYYKGIEMLLASYEKNPGAVYGLMGVRDNTFIHTENIPSDYEYYVVNVLGGYRGVLYKANLFSRGKFFSLVDTIQRAHRSSNMILMHDDHVFSYYFKMMGIERRVAKFIPGEIISERIAYNPIDNNDGIMQDPRSAESMRLIEKVFRDRMLDEVLTAPY
jgi:hypothetical protein